MQAEETLETELELEMRTLEDALEVAEMRLETYRVELAQRQIRAPFTGTLTFVRDYAKGELSEYGIRAMVLVDSALSLFRADTGSWDIFEPGDVYEVVVKQKTYTITAADEEELGIEKKEKVPGKITPVYFTLQEPDFTLSEGDFGSIEVVHEYREDTLHLPIEAVKKSGDKEIVFYLDENGIRAYKEVTTGIRNSKRVEILGGLSEGDQIIID
jgi:multidrug efflux pump subunit AcrA (membrane-fusion protein)